MRKITVDVKTNSKEKKIEKISNNLYRVRLKATPVEGKANKQLISMLAEYFGVAKSQIEIRVGKTSKTKVLAIYG